MESIVSSLSNGLTVPKLNVSSAFGEGQDVFNLDGTLLLSFNMIYDSLPDEYDTNFDHSALRTRERKYKSVISFVDTLGTRVFIIEINPVFSTLTLGSDYKKVS